MGQLTESIPLNWNVGPYWLSQRSGNVGPFFWKGIDTKIIAKRYGRLDSLIPWPRVLWNFHTKNWSSGVQEHPASEKSLRRVWKQISCRFHKSKQYQPRILQLEQWWNQSQQDKTTSPLLREKTLKSSSCFSFNNSAKIFYKWVTHDLRDWCQRLKDAMSWARVLDDRYAVRKHTQAVTVMVAFRSRFSFPERRNEKLWR